MIYLYICGAVSYLFVFCNVWRDVRNSDLSFTNIIMALSFILCPILYFIFMFFIAYPEAKKRKKFINKQIDTLFENEELEKAIIEATRKEKDNNDI